MKGETMIYEIEVEIYAEPDSMGSFYDEEILTVEFNEDTWNDYKVHSYKINDKEISLEELKKSNPNIEKKLERAIEHFITNMEDSWITL
jgi:hypothetical protein